MSYKNLSPIKVGDKFSCYNCNELYIKPRKATGLFCSKTCFYKYRNSNYYPGEMIYKGYKLLYKPNYPGTNSTGHIREHRFIVENSLGRLLTKNEFIHHVNGNKLDNRLDNLVIVTQSEHALIHGREMGWARLYKECQECSKADFPHWGRGLCKKCYEWLKSKGLLDRYKRDFKYSSS